MLQLERLNVEQPHRNGKGDPCNLEAVSICKPPILVGDYKLDDEWKVQEETRPKEGRITSWSVVTYTAECTVGAWTSFGFEVCLVACI